MHQKHIAHMDLKEDNVINNYNLDIKILGFGLSLKAPEVELDEPYFGCRGTYKCHLNVTSLWGEN